MRKLVFTLALTLIAGACFAQKKAVKSAKSELKEKEPNFTEARGLIKGALTDPETKDQAETWYVAGLIENKQLDLENGKEILGQEPNKEVMYKALDGILPYFEKAYELDQLPDEKGKVKPKFSKDIVAITNANRFHYVNAGLFYYDKKDYPNAYKNFKLYGDIPNLPFMKKEAENEGEDAVKEGVVLADSVETQIKYYAALSASLIPDYKKAITLYDAIKNDGYQEKDIYQKLIYLYGQEKDTVALESILKKGIEKFPEDDDFLFNLINVSIFSGKTEQGIAYLHEAIEKNPTNSRLYDVLGQVLETEKRYDEAIAELTKAVEIDPENAEILSHLGRIYYNIGIDSRAKADENLKDKAVFEAETKKSLDSYRKAMPYFEKAYQLNPKDTNSIYALRTIYYNLNMGEEFDKMDAIYNKIVGEE